jgi:hypothetical protein
MGGNILEASLSRVASFLSAHGSAYCADCLRSRLSLGRTFTSAKLFKAAADHGLVQKPATCDCCRRSRTVLQASSPQA